MPLKRKTEVAKRAAPHKAFAAVRKHKISQTANEAKRMASPSGRAAAHEQPPTQVAAPVFRSVVDLRDEEMVTMADALRIIGGDSTPINRTTLLRGRKQGIYPAPIPISTRCWRYNVGELRRALARLKDQCA